MSAYGLSMILRELARRLIYYQRLHLRNGAPRPLVKLVHLGNGISGSLLGHLVCDSRGLVGRWPLACWTASLSGDSSRWHFLRGLLVVRPSNSPSIFWLISVLIIPWLSKFVLYMVLLVSGVDCYLHMSRRFGSSAFQVIYDRGVHADVIICNIRSRIGKMRISLLDIHIRIHTVIMVIICYPHIR